MNTIIEFLHQVNLFNQQYLFPIWQLTWTAFKTLGAALLMLVLYVVAIEKFDLRTRWAASWKKSIVNWERDRYLKNLLLANLIYVYSHPLLLGSAVWFIVTIFGSGASGTSFILDAVILFLGIVSHLYTKAVIFRYVRRMCREIQEDFWAYGLLMLVVPLGSYFASRSISREYYEKKELAKSSNSRMNSEKLEVSA